MTDENWEKEDGMEVKNFYHQVTRWSEGNYRHDIHPSIVWGSPEKTRTGLTTRSYAISQRGITCIGLGANEFERNNYLPKFRESNFFALILAWYFDIIQKLEEINISTEWIETMSRFPISSLFEEKPRQEFFEACLEFKGMGKKFPSPEFKTKLQKIFEAKDVSCATNAASNVFKKIGSYWTITYEGQTIQVKDIKALHYISYLLRNNSKKIDVLQLYGSAKEAKQAMSLSISREELSQENLRTLHQEYSEKILDETATKDYQKAIEGLNELLQEAQENNDIEEAEEVQKKIAFVQSQLKNAIGYKHNPRRFSNTAQERARKNISNSISRVIAMIEKEHKTLGLHFRRTIKTGYTCSYEPEKEILWVV